MGRFQFPILSLSFLLFFRTYAQKRSVAGCGRKASPREVYGGEEKEAGRPLATEGGSSRSWIVKLAVFLLVAIFAFMLIRRMVSNPKREIDFEDQI